MIDQQRRSSALVFTTALLLCSAATISAQAVPDLSAVVQGVDSSVKNRIDRLAGYTVTEHYAVFRGHDESKQVADMVVKTTYRKESGKNFTIMSQSGSSFWRGEVLDRLLDNEKRMSQPANVGTALINSSNYEMSLDQNSGQRLDGRDCVVLDISPRRSSEFLFKGKLWVDAHDYAIIQLKGTAGKSAFFLASAAEVTRQYTEISSVPMATHAKAVSSSALLGQTVVKIEYTNYSLDLPSASQKTVNPSGPDGAR